MGSDIDVHSEERSAASGSYTARTLTLELGVEPALPGAPAKKGALLDFNGQTIAGAVKAGPFQDLGAAATTYTFWNDAALPALPALPEPPTAVSVGKLSDVRTRVAWTNASLDASYVEVERRVDGGPWKFWGYITTTQDFFEDYELAPSSNYEYRVAARNAAGLSSWVEAAPSAAPPAAVEGDCKWQGQ